MDEGRNEPEGGPDPRGNTAERKRITEPLSEQVPRRGTAEEEQPRRERFAEESRAGLDGLRAAERSS